MIEREGGRVVICCDSCSEVHEGDPGGDFNEVWDEAKREGWHVFQVKGEWIHTCPVCDA
jgi:hypothetical protein